MGCMKTEHDNTTDIGVCQGCLTDAEAEVTKLKLQIEEIKVALRVALPSTMHVLTGHVYGPAPDNKLVEFVDGCARCRIESILQSKPLKRVDETLVHKDCAHGEIMVIHKCAECGEKIEFV